MSGGSERILPISRFDYHLPPELIAQQPVEPRDSSRLLVVDRSRQSLSDRVFSDLPDLLQPGDLLVMNNSRVLNARLFVRRQTGGRVEMLFLEETGPGVWNVLAKPARRLKTGEQLTVLSRSGEDTEHTVQLEGREPDGTMSVRLDQALSVLADHGHLPLPPYITEQPNDEERYQTVYAEQTGSAAAPTAGLHFTDRLLERCRERGIETAWVTLHVGLGTFQPVKVENALEHRIHAETFEVPADTMTQLAGAREEGRRIVAVGSTAVRTLETIGLNITPGRGQSGSTQVYITPPYEFRLVDAMVTNFHLPRTTLLLMVSALAGEDLLRAAYEHAVRERYRFFSFGDAMLIV